MVVVVAATVTATPASGITTDYISRLGLVRPIDSCLMKITYVPLKDLVLRSSGSMLCDVHVTASKSMDSPVS